MLGRQVNPRWKVLEFKQYNHYLVLISINKHQCYISHVYTEFFPWLSRWSLATLSWVTAFIFILGGKVAMEGKVEHKFDMKPHGENIEEYGKLCRERTNKSMIKNRQIQVCLLFNYPLMFLAFCLWLNNWFFGSLDSIGRLLIMIR